MNIRIIIISFCIFVSTFSCHDSRTATMQASETQIITGKFSHDLFESNDGLKTWFEPNYNAYKVDYGKIDSLFMNANDREFILVLGTWCGDSKREVPKILKIFDTAKISFKHIVLFGVDRSKKSSDGFTEKHHISNVPTLIILNKKGDELGRIVEHPQHTWEYDIGQIIVVH